MIMQAPHYRRRSVTAVAQDSVHHTANRGLYSGCSSGQWNVSSMIGPLTAGHAALIVAIITCVAFLNSFIGTFVFDDIHET